ncbi:hypothetical protein MUN82_07540 [Hymenobacter aerilatus]|uniref:Uncharacterized protein n=1 Tax=Hymenobacter aerilatus TaxID=2932251 RepID=A0A8T9SYK7_9BACT|nr:hypothetical protein [Hymenobacter aerilatus]UOR06945.1 hypothetical protein MUN82_07540 [Hymenobacter aerilatus]
MTLKELLTDIATCYDAGWFVDEQTGYLRLEHRAWLEARDIAPLDISEKGYLKYSYAREQMPRVERLQVVHASTGDVAIDFQEGGIQYGGNCVNQTEGQNESIRMASLIMGDIRGLLLNGDSLPNTSLCLLVATPLQAGELTQQVEAGNRAVAASELLKRYHRRGRVIASGVLLPSKQYVHFDSVRPTIQLEKASTCVSLQEITLRRLLTTVYGLNGRLQRAEEDLATGMTAVIACHTISEPTSSMPSFDRMFAAEQFNPEQFG